MKAKCKNCDKEYEIPIISANIMVVCPDCHQYIGSMSDCGQGPITPCSVFIGSDCCGKIIKNDTGEYQLETEWGKYTLTKGYENLGCYKESAEIIKKEFPKMV